MRLPKFILKRVLASPSLSKRDISSWLCASKETNETFTRNEKLGLKLGPKWACKYGNVEALIFCYNAGLMHRNEIETYLFYAGSRDFAGPNPAIDYLCKRFYADGVREIGDSFVTRAGGVTSVTNAIAIQPMLDFRLLNEEIFGSYRLHLRIREIKRKSIKTGIVLMIAGPTFTMASRMKKTKYDFIDKSRADIKTRLRPLHVNSMDYYRPRANTSPAIVNDCLYIKCVRSTMNRKRKLFSAEDALWANYIMISSKSTGRARNYLYDLVFNHYIEEKAMYDNLFKNFDNGEWIVLKKSGSEFIDDNVFWMKDD